jgi:hypothetical protein
MSTDTLIKSVLFSSDSIAAIAYGQQLPNGDSDDSTYKTFSGADIWAAAQDLLVPAIKILDLGDRWLGDGAIASVAFSKKTYTQQTKDDWLYLVEAQVRVKHTAELDDGSAYSMTITTPTMRLKTFSADRVFQNLLDECHKAIARKPRQINLLLEDKAEKVLESV